MPIWFLNIVFINLKASLQYSIPHIKSINTISPMANVVKTLAAHNGTFHCDDALAISLLRMLPEYADSRTIRTRDKSVLDGCDVVVDVGGEYDPQRFRFDHHQASFNTRFSDKHTLTKLSASGLIYKHFGKRILTEKFGIHSDHLDDIYNRIYNSFMEPIDAIDNGVEATEGKLKYSDNTNLASRVANLNPTWVDEDPNYDEKFEDAVKLTGSEFVDAVNRAYHVWYPAREIVQDAYNVRFDTHPSGRVIELFKYCPYTEHIYAIEESNGGGPEVEVYFVLYKGLNQWRCTCVSVKNSSFKSRFPFPEEYRGLKSTELIEKSGIDHLEFVHHSGFTCGGHTRQSVLELIDRTLSS